MSRYKLPVILSFILLITIFSLIFNKKEYYRGEYKLLLEIDLPQVFISDKDIDPYAIFLKDISSENEYTRRRLTNFQHLFLFKFFNREDFLKKFYKKYNLDPVENNVLFYWRKDDIALYIRVLSTDFKNIPRLLSSFKNEIEEEINNKNISFLKKQRAGYKILADNIENTIKEEQRKIYKIYKENIFSDVSGLNKLLELYFNTLKVLLEKKIELEKVKVFYKENSPEYTLISKEVREVQKNLQNLRSEILFSSRNAILKQKLGISLNSIDILKNFLIKAKKNEILLDTLIKKRKIYFFQVVHKKVEVEPEKPRILLMFISLLIFSLSLFLLLSLLSAKKT